MKRQLQRLSPKGVANQKAPGLYCDGGGLYLQVSDSGTKSWIFRYAINGRERQMGLGPFHTVSLADARGAATDNRKLLLKKVDPITARDADHAMHALVSARAVPFSRCAADYIDAHKADWKNKKHAAQWTATIETYSNPIAGALPVQDVDTGIVLRILEPIWKTKPETATRLRGRIESILDWAKVRGYRQGDNPARWRGHLDNVLPSLKKRQRVKHHAAMPFDQIGEFMVKLRAVEGVPARALEFTILTVARTAEVVEGKETEFDLASDLWTIPGARMKAGVEHRVPLTRSAIDALPTHRESEYMFPGRNHKKPLSNMAMLQLLKRMGYGHLTVHGFRSTFRDWASERTSYPREVCEMALAHTVSDQVEAAYRRGDLLEKRRRLMQEWAKHCETVQPAGKVVNLKRA